MLKQSVLVYALVFPAFQAVAELKAIDEAMMGDVVGQAAPEIEVSGGITYEAIVYHPADGSAPQVVLPGESSSDQAVSTQSLTFQGQMFGLPKAGGALDLLSIIMPIRVGAVDIDGDGQLDRGAAMFSFQPDVGLGSQFSPLEISMDDQTVNIHDQVFLTKQGILFLNAPLANEPFEIPGQTGQYQLVPQKFF
ncbi:MAG: hypothetical protein IPM37_09215 [Hahellaceae bacterium]|nr:hypothetical protein [Hahellaceae bacterium]MBK8971522.1 hypothetical protein [Hahellaceae bacterium]